MIGIVVPAHNEENHLGACLESLRRAARCPLLRGEDVLIVVALDACSDGTEAIARSQGAVTVSVDARNVGIARARGTIEALQRDARWLAFTDADSTVAPNWISTQLALCCDAVCGTIEVCDWSEHSEQVRRHHKATYCDRDGHRHIHGANLGVAASAYRRVGGFQPLGSSADVALVRALQAHGASIAWSAAPRVVTSARRCYRPRSVPRRRWTTAEADRRARWRRKSLRTCRRETDVRP